ncbi:ABC transporter ATP-binding protein [Aureimonas populi]|uniref:ABC transporter ATP-binding protein n=1 Tax=Aureimonas populi TaxID=1701758 RepID=A0ABW5CJ32_9HYPH|nr:ABC transporter ATP-binding protein [Aureimonas populi]
MRGASITLERTSIDVPGRRIVSDIDLRIEAGEFVCLLGPSGCGKSTILNAIAGFMRAGGRLLVDGKPVAGPGPDRGVVFQSSEALFPWLSVEENVAYGLKLRKVPRARQREICAHYLSMVGLAHAAGQFPAQLSGGMRQRVQIARVLANEPAVVLMDEPFGALDAQTREVLQREVQRIWQATRTTFLFVTHDIAEAVLLADRVVTMTAGPAAGIKSVTAIDIPHPRDPTSPDFARVQRALREIIADEVRRAMGEQPGMAGAAA